MRAGIYVGKLLFSHLFILYYCLAVKFQYNSYFFNPLLHRYSFLRLLRQTTFENIVAKEEIAPA